MAEYAIELLKLASSAIAGGVAGHLTARRSERDAAIKDLLDLIQAAAEAAEDYWCEGPDRPDLARRARKLKVTVARVARANARLAGHFPTYRFARVERIIAFRQAATDGNFDMVGRAPELARLERIHASALDLRESVEDARCYFWQIPYKSWPAAVLQICIRR